MKILVFGGDSGVARALSKLNKKDKIVLIGKEEVDVTMFGQAYLCISKHKPDCVVNCAGVCFDTLFFYKNRGAYYEEINVNLMGSINVAAACCEQRVDKMVFVSSMSGMHGRWRQLGYCASKAGVISLVQSLADGGHDAYCVSPSRIDTEMNKGRIKNGFIQKTKRGEILSAEEVAATIRFCIDGLYPRGANIVIYKVGKRTERKIWESWVSTI